jgi:viroplasmin and RNaseH domain-containing protein
MQEVVLYNEKGNVIAKTRNALKAGILPTLTEALDAITGTDGALYVAIATNERAETVYARLEVTVSVKDPFAVKE